jgi:diguanylate cyclase (GGDEF)-like protein
MTLAEAVMISLKEPLLKIGPKKSIVLITLTSLILALLVTILCITFLFKVSNQERIHHLVIAVIVTLTVAPLIAYEVISLLFKINALEVETRSLAAYDPLTNLFSRRIFYELAEQQLKVACREKSSVAVMMMDVDEFKKINDQHGHFVGDQTLKLLGKIISDTIRVSDIAGRVGGDEFILCLPNTSAEGAKMLGSRLIAATQESQFNIDGMTIKMGLSIGVHARVIENGYDLNDLFKLADLALYEAKRRGKNQVRLSEVQPKIESINYI